MRLPPAVRTASTITAVVMVDLLAFRRRPAGRGASHPTAGDRAGPGPRPAPCEHPPRALHRRAASAGPASVTANGRQGHGPLVGRRRHADHRRRRAARSTPTASTGRTSAGCRAPSTPDPLGLQPPRDGPGRGPRAAARRLHELRHQRRPVGGATDEGHPGAQDRDMRPAGPGRRATACGARWCAWPARSPTARGRCATPGSAGQPGDRDLPPPPPPATEAGAQCRAPGSLGWARAARRRARS